MSDVLASATNPVSYGAGGTDPALARASGRARGHGRPKTPVASVKILGSKVIVRDEVGTLVDGRIHRAASSCTSYFPLHYGWRHFAVAALGAPEAAAPWRRAKTDRAPNYL